MAARDAVLLSQAIAVAGKDAIVLDLGSGTGSTARAMTGEICQNWTWRFVDGDAALLQHAHDKHPGSDCIVMNLRDIDELPLVGVSLVTASALLDLMPEDWITDLACRLQDVAVPFYACLNYDGYMQWSPPLDTDTLITQDFNTHQCTDKGIGPAMGPQSGHRAAEILSDHGFDVTLSHSPWELDPRQAALSDQLIAGIGAAAEEMGNPVASDWVKKRSADIARSTTVIGHTDLLAVPRKRD